MRKIKHLLIVLLFGAFLVAPVFLQGGVAFAAPTGIDGTPTTAPTAAGPATTGDTGNANLRTLNCGPHDDSTFLGFPTWYKYLKPSPEDNCPSIQSISDIWGVVLAIIEFMLRVAVFIAVGLVIWGGIKMIMSQGEPENFANGRKIIQNALIGMAITMVATAIVTFIGNQFKG